MYAPLSWSSSDPSIVALNDRQQPTAQGVSAYARGVGSATLTVISGSKSASVSVVVRAPGPVATITLTPVRSVALGSTLQIIVAQRDSDGVALTTTMPTFLSSDSTILRVSATGLMTALAEGSATVSATNNGKIGSATISVTAGARAFVWTALAGMIDLGVLPGFAVSKATAVSAMGHIAGTMMTADASLSHAFVRAPGVTGAMRDLGALTDGGQSGALGVNGVGQVVGYATTAADVKRAALWSASGDIQDLGTLPGDLESEARAINDAGQVVGWSGRGGNTQSFLWTAAEGMRRIPGTENGGAFAINSTGMVAGQSRDRPFVWSASLGLRSLPMIEDHDTGSAFALNNLGEAVGVSIGCDELTNYYGDCYQPSEYPLLWPATGGFVELKTAGFGPGPGVRVSGINRSGQMAGVGAGGRALLWDAGSSRDLGVLPNRIQSTATAINDLGQVVGWSGNP